MKRYFFFFSFFLFSISSSAQQFEKYFDYQYRPSAVDNAIYYAVTVEYGELFHRRYYYLRDDKLQMEGFYADRKCKVKEGYFRYYYPGGSLEIKCSYIKNKLQGRYLSFYDNGNMKTYAHYEKGNLVGKCYTLYPDGMMKDSTVMYKDGSGSSASWHQNGKPSSAGYFAAGRKMRGTWQFFHNNGKQSAIEIYDAGKLVDKKYFDENGNEEKGINSNDRAVGFPGGDSAWKKYESHYAIFPAGWEIKKTGPVVVVVSAVIDEEGNVSDALVSSPFHPAFDGIALKMMRSSPRWLPAIEHHRKIKAEIRQPVSFVQAK